MKLFILINLAITGNYLQCYAQVLKQLKKKTQESELSSHYQYESKSGHYTFINLFLYKTGKFEYNLYSNVYHCFSTGTWEMNKNIIQLKSDLQKNNLPVKVIYVSNKTEQNNKRRIAIIKNLKNEDVTDAFIYVNNDSTRCIYGDQICSSSYQSIDSLKVLLENEIASGWISIEKNNSDIQLIIQSHTSLSNYIFFNKRYKKGKRVLIPLQD